MVQLLSVVGVVVSALAFGAVAFPTGPGTCLASGMTGVPHGSTLTTGGGYSLTITPILRSAASAAANTTTTNSTTNSTTSLTRNYEVTINGNGSFTGLLLYALDTANNNTRFGTFVKPPAGFGPHIGCKGVDPAANTLGHINAKVKKLPVRFIWTPAAYNPAKQFVASFTGIVMTTNAKVWYVLDPQSPGSTPSAPPLPSSTPAAATPSLATSETSANTNASATSTTTSTTSSAAIHSRSSISSLALVALLSAAALWL